MKNPQEKEVIVPSPAQQRIKEVLDNNKDRQEDTSTDDLARQAIAAVAEELLQDNGEGPTQYYQGGRFMRLEEYRTNEEFVSLGKRSLHPNIDGDLDLEITQLENEIKDDARAQGACGKDGTLVTKSRKCRKQLNDIAIKHDAALETIMEKLELKAIDRTLTEQNKRKLKLRKEATYDDELPACRQLRWARKAIAKNMRITNKVRKEHKRLQQDPDDPTKESIANDILTLARGGTTSAIAKVKAAIESHDAEMQEQADEREAMESSKGKPLDPSSASIAHKLKLCNMMGKKNCEQIDLILKENGCSNLISTAFHGQD